MSEKDETKEIKQDSSQVTEDTSGGSKGSTSETKAKTYTEEEVQKVIKKAESDALSKAGRTATALEKREAAIKAKEDAIAEQERQKDAAELEEAKTDPDKMAVYRAKQTRKQQETDLKKERAELDRDKADHEAEITAVREAQKEITIWQVASAKNIDPMRLKTLSDKFNIEGKENLEELAAEIASGKPEPTTETKVDSGVTSGGIGEKSEEQRLKERYPSMYKK